MLSLFNRVTGFLLLILAMPGIAGAADLAQVGRLAAAEGDVQVSYGEGAETWEAAAVNHPVAPGARLFVGPFGRAEIRVGANALRLNGQALLDVVTLEDRAVQLRLDEGTLQLALRDVAPEAQLEVATPGALLTIRAPGSYRVDADAESTRVVVRYGEALVRSGAHETLLSAGKAVVASASGLVVNDGASAYGLDDFDRWCFAREAEGGGTYSDHVPPVVTGYEMLDRSGSWSTYSGYGTVWTPGSAYGWWTPYTFGRWAWVPPWGWTWVDAAPWAFTTFRFGHWMNFDGRWWWAPGSLLTRPVYSGFVPLHPVQIAFTSAFFVRGKPASHFAPLAPRHFTAAKRSLYGWPQGNTLPPSVRALTGRAPLSGMPGSPRVGGAGAAGLPAGIMSPRIAPRPPGTAATLPSEASRRGSSGLLAPALPAPASPAAAAPPAQRGTAPAGSAAAAPAPQGSDPASAGPGAAPARSESPAPALRGSSGRMAGWAVGGGPRPRRARSATTSITRRRPRRCGKDSCREGRPAFPATWAGPGAIQCGRADGRRPWRRSSRTRCTRRREQGTLRPGGVERQTGKAGRRHTPRDVNSRPR